MFHDPNGKTRERFIERNPARVPEIDGCTFTNGITSPGNKTAYARRRKAIILIDGKRLLKLTTVRVKRKISVGFTERDVIGMRGVIG